MFLNTNNTSNFPITPDIPENLQSKIEAFEVKKALKNIEDELVKNEEVIIVNNIVIKENDVVASTSYKKDIIKKDLIKLKFIEPTWIQIRNNDNNIVISKLMQIKDEFSYTIDQKYLLTTGNAGNVLVYINGELIGKVGKKGEVIDSLFIDSNFNN